MRIEREEGGLWSWDGETETEVATLAPTEKGEMKTRQRAVPNSLLITTKI